MPMKKTKEPANKKAMPVSKTKVPEGVELSDPDLDKVSGGASYELKNVQVTSYRAKRDPSLDD